MADSESVLVHAANKPRIKYATIKSMHMYQPQGLHPRVGREPLNVWPKSGLRVTLRFVL